jgi:hypothetical protein
MIAKIAGTLALGVPNSLKANEEIGKNAAAPKNIYQKTVNF